MAVNALPDRLVKRHISDGLAQIHAEGDRPWILFTQQSQLDNYTDRVMLQQSQRVSEWNEAVQQFVLPQYWEPYHANAVHNPLYAAFWNQGYPRYWHGYTVVLKPLLAVMSYQSIRFVSAIALLLLLAAAFQSVYRLFGGAYAAMLAPALAVMNVNVVPMSLQYSASFYVMLIALILLRRIIDHPVPAFLIIGAVINFLDFLTFPLVTLAFPLAFTLLAQGRDGDARVRGLLPRLLLAVRCAAAWGVAYASTWAVKWVLSTLVTRQNIVSNALEATVIRSGSSDNGEKVGRLATVALNYRIGFWQQHGLLMILALCAAMAVLAIRGIAMRHNLSSLRDRLADSALLACVAVLPVAWYMVLTNHSYVHATFLAYRDVGITVLCIGLIGMTLVRTVDARVGDGTLPLAPARHGNS